VYYIYIDMFPLDMFNNLQAVIYNLHKAETCKTMYQWIPKCAPQFPRDPWIHSCDGYFEVYFFFN